MNNFINSGVAPLNEFHLQMLKRVLKLWQSLRFVAKKLTKSWHETVVLAGLGQFCNELVEGSIPSTITWNRAPIWCGWVSFDSKKTVALLPAAL